MTALKVVGLTLAMLYRGDLDVAEGSSTYALFRGQLSPTLEASDLSRAEGAPLRR